MLRRRGIIAAALAAVIVMAACASNNKTGGSATTAGAGTRPTTSTTIGKLTASFRGVTASEIKIGVTMIDYATIKNFITFDRGNEQQTAQAIIDDINRNGGVLGRKLVPVFKKYLPVGNTDALKKCTELTQDEKVFAVLGLVYDPTGQAQLCISKQNQTVHVGFELRDAWLQQAGGLMVTPSRSLERSIRVLVKLLENQKFFQTNKKVAILTDQNTEKDLVQGSLKPALDAVGVAQGTPAVLAIAGTDTSAAQAQLDSVIERWKSEKVTALFMASETAASKQFVEKIKRALPDVTLVAAVDTGVEQAGKDEVAAKKNPNPYEGTYALFGQTPEDTWNNNTFYQDKCVKVWEAATGKKLTAPQDVKPTANGTTDERWIAVIDYCTLLYMFKDVAERVGANLTNDGWTAAVKSFGAINLVGQPDGSLGDGKYDASDPVRLARFSSTYSGTGGWKPLTSEMFDAAQLLAG